MHKPLHEFNLENDLGVFVLPDYVGFSYSDGEAVEKRIFDILTSTLDLSASSRELFGKISDWPTEYHFSPLRHNVLRHIEFRSGDRVLELGAGCGAITRQLGEKELHVTVIEGSYLRAACA